MRAESKVKSTPGSSSAHLEHARDRDASRYEMVLLRKFSARSPRETYQ